MADETLALARFATETTLESIPAEVQERAKTLILDTMGIAIRARHEGDATPSLMSALRSLGYGGGSAHTLGDADGWSPMGAALLNGAFAHSLDFDDTHAAGSIHPSAPIVPAALAAAEMVNADGAKTLEAIIIGYEIQIRLSLAMNPSEHYARGYHPTATCGAFGAAAAAGHVLGLSTEQMVNAFGLSQCQAAGTLEFLTEGSWSKPFQVGWAAHGGVVAATCARDDFFAPQHGVEGKRGFLSAYAPNSNPARAVADLGSVWETMNIAVKPYPSCRYSHAAMDAVKELTAANDIKPEEVSAIHVGLPVNGMAIIGEPLATKHKPSSIVDGQFSMPFLAAVTLREGGLGWDDYKEHLKDEATLALTQKVDCKLDERAEAAFPANMAGAVEIETARGSFSTFVEIPKGEPKNWPTAEEHRAKFDFLVSPRLSADKSGALAEAVLSLETQASMIDVLELSRPAPAALLAAGED